MKTINIGMIGTGFMAKVHSCAYATMPLYFPKSAAMPIRKAICDVTEESAKLGAQKYGWESYEVGWENLLARKDIDLVDIVTPEHIHKDIAIAAAKAGKMIYCEKPQARDSAEAKEMYEFCKQVNVKTAVAFNKRRLPAVEHARKLIDEGFVGDPWYFRGTYMQGIGLELALVDGSWRTNASVVGKAGIFADIGSHSIDLCRYLLGDFDEVVGFARRYHPLKPVSAPLGETEVYNAGLFLAKLKSGVACSFEVLNSASGEGDGCGFEIWGSKGALKWNEQRFQELEISSQADPGDRRGFKIVELGGIHHPCRGEMLWVIPGLGIGYDANKAIEIHDVIDAFVNDKPFSPDFYEGWKVAQVVDAVMESTETGRWVKLPDC